MTLCEQTRLLMKSSRWYHPIMSNLEQTDNPYQTETTDGNANKRTRLFTIAQIAGVSVLLGAVLIGFLLPARRRAPGRRDE